jgi:hypothetical protein
MADLLDRHSPLVISAPGAVAIGPANKARLADAAIVVWTRADVSFLADLGDPAHRPRLDGDQTAALSRLDAELAPVYAEIAHLDVDVEAFHPDRTDRIGQVRRVDDGTRREPREAIARHIVERLGLEIMHQPRPVAAGQPPETIAMWSEVADIRLDVEPFHRPGGQPKRAIARHIIGLLADGESNGQAR